MSAYSKYTDEDLVKLIHAGNTVAFTEAYNRYWEQLLALGYYYTHSKPAAEDIVHEVFISLWTRRRDVTILSLKAYLATAVKFSVFKAISRDRRRRQIRQGLSAPAQTTDLEEKLDARFLEDYFKGVVEQLPDKTRLIFNYSRTEELSVKEIADKMELSPKAVEYHLTKAVRALREAVRKIRCFFV